MSSTLEHSRPALHLRPRRLLLALAVVVALVAATLVLPAPTAQAACSGNAVVCENQLPGTPASVWDVSGVGDTSIQGFATASSVNAGSRIDFKVKTDARAYTVNIYRLGWYQGNGARLVAAVNPSAPLPQTQPPCATSTATEIYDCGGWGVSASWNVPATAVSGVYFADLVRNDTQGDSHIPFVVRNDGNTSDIVFQTSDQTWQAYNTYGGSSFYTGNANGRAYKLSYNRPYATRGLAGGRDFLFSNEYPMIRYLEQNGYDTSYVAGLDVANDAALLSKHKTFMSVGHDEYWTAPQRRNVTVARDAGVNLAFMGGNDVYWKSRWEPSQDGTSTAGRTLVTYKDTWTKDNSYGSQGNYDPVEPTPTWRDPRFGVLDYGYGPENALIGTQFQANSVDMAIKVSATEGKLRLWRDTSLATMAAGATATLSDHTIGYEANEDVDNGYRPAGLIDLSTTTGTAQEYLTDYGSTVSPQPFTHHLTTYRAASGALVFSSGTIQWPWGLDSNHDGTATPADPRMRQATANMLADGGVLPTTVAAGMTQPSQSTDTTPPTVTITDPGTGANIPQGSTITVKGTAADTGGQVAGVEVSTDGGASFHPATGTTAWSYTGVLSGNGTSAVQARATDDSSRTSAAVTLSLTSPCPCSLFGVATPRLADAGDGDDLTLGTKFVPTRSGFITGIRFYKSAANTGTHTGTLYTSGGAVKATGTFTNETSSGWQTLTFPSGVAVDAGTTYVAAYHAPSGHYSADTNFFRTNYSAGVLTAPGTAAVANGVYATGTAFPQQTYQQTNYWVDPVWSSTNDVPVLINTYRPSAGATTVQVTTNPSVTFSRDVDPATVMMQMVDGAGTTVPGTVTYNAATFTATFNPAQGLAPSTSYTVTVNAAGLSSAAQWSFTTAAVDTPGSVCPCTLFNQDDAPSTPTSDDTQRVSLGVAFSASSSGQIAGIRFWKSAANTGTHTVALWSGGTKLGEATATQESSSGWQEADFASPISISAGNTYVAAYTAPNGRYGYTSGGLASGISSGPLSTPANGGRYTYGTDAPAATTSTNYYVDPVFLPAASVAPAVRSIAPGDKATSVPTGARVTVTFTTDVQPGTAQIAVKRTSDGTVIAGTATNESQASQVSFVPSADLDPATGYTVTVKGARNLAGTAMSGTATSSFTTSGAAACPCSLLESTTQPVLSDSADTAAVTLGLKFSPTVNGSITALRYYRDATNTGTHTGTLYSGAGVKLATVTFAESGTGWQTAQLSASVPVTAGATYVAAYYAPNGHYSASSGFFANDVVNNPLRSVAPGGVYTYANGFPDQTYMSTSYLVDVLFTPASNDAPTVTAVSPAAGATGVPAGTAVTSTFGSAIDPTTLTLTVTSPSGQLVGGQLAYDAPSRTATFTTAGPLADGTTYKAVVNANAPSGTAMASPRTWSFTVADTQPPVVTSTSPVAGATQVSKSPTLTATFARPVDPATLAFTLKSTSTAAAVAGATTWDATTNTATFKPTGALADVTSYTASVAASNVSGVAMTAPQTWAFTTTDGAAPTVVSTVPAAGATNVAASTPVSATFAKAVDPASVQLSLKTSAGSAVAGTVAYDATSLTARLTPGAALPGATTYTATVTAKNPSGVAMTAPKTWTFTTADTDAPSVTAQSPAAGATNVVASTNVTATFARAVSTTGLALSLKAADGTTVAGATSYNATSRVLTFNPSADLTSSTTYTASVTARSAAGVAMTSPTTWSFTTVAQAYSLYATTRTPAATSVLTTPTTVGVQFRSARAGSVTAIRYYAASTNTGGTVKLWGANGAQLATATTSQTGTGWRTATFATPVAIAAGTTYTASYYAPVGRWSTTSFSYAGAYTAGPLTVPALGGVSSNGDVRPTGASSTNYWVDVVVSI